MTKGKTAAIVLAAGLGTRMNSSLPKALHPLGGIPMLNHLLTTLDALGVDRTVVVTGPDMADVGRAAAPHTCAVQSERLGTAHAVLAAKPALADFSGDILMVYVDTPLIRAATLKALLGARRAKADPAVVVLGFRPAEPGAYGRLIVERGTGGAGALAAIVEAKDATPAQLNIDLCNSGVMALDGARLWPLLERIGNDNAKGEYYLTDVVAIAREAGFAAAMVEGEASEFAGINSRADLAAVCVECAMSDAAAGKTFEVYDAGTALATSSLSLSGILSDPAARAVARFVTREGAPTPVPVTGCEIRGRSDYASLFAKLR